MCASALGAHCRHFLGHDCLAALVAVIRGNAVSPPQLAADAPVADIVSPVEVGLLHSRRDQLDVAFLDALDGGLDQLVHLDEPLLLDQRLDCRAAAVVCADVVAVVLDADEQTHLIEFFYDLRSCLVAVHTAELRAVLIDRRVVVHDVDLRQVVTLSDFKVVGVVCRGDLDDARTEFPVNIFICHDRDPAVHEGKPDVTADQVVVALILGMDCHCSIAEHSLGTRCGELEESCLGDRTVLFDQRIFDVPEMAGLLFILHFRVGDGSVADRTPVDDPASLVDPALFVHLHKYFGDGLIAALIHREALTVPVAGGAELLELVDDPSAILFAPVPAVFQELFAAEILLADPLLLEVVDDLDFRSDGGVIGAGLPQSVIALHALPADQDILHCIVECMTHMELSGNVRRRDHDGKRCAAVIHFRVEVFLIFPVFIDPVLNPLGIIRFGEHLSHVLFSLVNVLLKRLQRQYSLLPHYEQIYPCRRRLSTHVNCHKALPGPP